LSFGYALRETLRSVRRRPRNGHVITGIRRYEADVSLLEGIRGYYELFGVKGLLLATKSRILREAFEVVVSVPGLESPVYLRIRTTDISLLSEVILRSEYGWQFSKSPRIIIDAGANIGLSPVFFARRYPNATVIAIEPEPANFELLRKNAAPYPNIVPVRAALWGDNRDLGIADPGSGNWGYQTLDDCNGSAPAASRRVTGTTLEKLMGDLGIGYVDVLKIDIEGAEKEVFEHSSPWIHKVGAIIVELHDRFKPGCSRSFREATADFDCEWQKGEITVVARKGFMANAAPYQEPGKSAELTCRIVGTVRTPENINA
jgi:FkbM family methyltransferase